MEIKVNGFEIEIGDSYPAITRKSIDVNNPSNRYIDFTNRFKIPATVENAKVFGSPQSVGSNGRGMDKLFDVEISDLFQIFKGKGYIIECDYDTYTLQVLDNSSDLYQAIDVKLKTILWDDKDVLLTQTSIDANDMADIESCWIWGKACYHKQPIVTNTDQTMGDDRTKYSRPAFYVQGLLNRAIALVGYTLVPSVPDLAISSNHKDFWFTSYQKTFNQTFNVSGSLTLTGMDSYDFKLARIDVASTTIKETLKFQIRIRGHISTTAPLTLVVSAVDTTGTKIITSNFTLPASGDVDFTTSEIYDGVTGMTVTYTLTGTGTAIFTDALVYSVLNEKYIDLSNNTMLGSKIKASEMLPDLTYLDLLKLICVTSNKYPIVDTLTKTVSFGSLADLNKNNSVDWSDKFIIGSENISSNFSGLYQKNYLRFENDITVPVDLGQYIFETDNETLVAEGEYMTLKFSASKDVSIGSNKIANVPIYDDTIRVDWIVNMRLFVVVGSCLQFAGVDWATVAGTYYQNYFNCLKRVREVSADFDLSKLDFLSWKQNKLVTVDYFKTAFLVEEMSNFIPGKKTRCKLLAYGR